MSIIRSMGDMNALALRSGGSSSGEDKKMTDVPNDVMASGESVRITMDGVNENGERISRVIAEWYGMSNEEANVFGMAAAGAVFSVVDSFREAKSAQGGGPVTKSPPGQMR